MIGLFRRTIAPSLLTLTMALSAGLCYGQSVETSTKPTLLSYAQLLVETVAYEHSELSDVSIYAAADDKAALALVAHTATTAGITLISTVQKVFESGNAKEVAAHGASQVLLPLVATSGPSIGVLSLTYRSTATPQGESFLQKSIEIRDYLRMITPKRETLFDPYVKGYDKTDTLAQRINQTLLARHGDVNVIAIHITAPDDTKNKVWGINRPNFIGRDSDEIDTDTEKTGRIVMQVIPATHRMEVHMPLLSPDGKLIGTLCTVYFWKSVSEAADFYGRSLSIMEEARKLTPTDRNDLFKP